MTSNSSTDAIPECLSGCAIGKKILKNLRYNVNTWKRVEASNRDKYQPAYAHFYENCLSDEVLKELGEMKRVEYFRWGDTDTLPQKDKGIPDIIQIGGRFPSGTGPVGGGWIPVGIRWAKNIEEWYRTDKDNAPYADKKGASPHTVRHITNRSRGSSCALWKPQIVLRFEDESILDYLRDVCSSVSREDNRRKLMPSMIEKNDKAQKMLENAEIIPMFFTLRIKRILSGNDSSKVQTTPSSRHHHDDDNTPDIEQAELEREEAGHYALMEKIGRACIAAIKRV